MNVVWCDIYAIGTLLDWFSVITRCNRARKRKEPGRREGSTYLPFLAGSAALVFLVPRTFRGSVSVYHSIMTKGAVVPSSRGSFSRFGVYAKVCLPWQQGQTSWIENKTTAMRDQHRTYLDQSVLGLELLL